MKPRHREKHTPAPSVSSSLPPHERAWVAHLTYGARAAGQRREGRATRAGNGIAGRQCDRTAGAHRVHGLPE